MKALVSIKRLVANKYRLKTHRKEISPEHVKLIWFANFPLSKQPHQ